MIPGRLFSSLDMRRKPFPSGTCGAEGECLPVSFPPLLALALFALLVVAIGFVIYLSARQSVTQAVHENLGAIARIKASQVEYWLNHQRHEIELAVATPLFVTELQRWLQSGMTDQRRQARLVDHLLAVAASEGYFNINIRAATDGTPLLVRAGSAGNASGRESALTAAQRMSAVMDDIRKVPEGDGKVRINFYFPISVDGKPLFIADIEADPSAFIFRQLKLWPGTSPSAEAILIKPEGDAVTYVSDLRRNPGAPLHLSLPVATPGLLAAQAARGRTGPLVGIDYAGVDAIGYATPVSGTNWFILAKVDRAEAYAVLDTLSLAAGGITVVLLLVAAGWIVERNRLAAANERQRRHMDEQLRASEERFRQAFEHAPIGMVMLDLEGRILASNPANCRLIGYSQAELAALTFFDVTHPDDRERDAEWLRTLAASKDAHCVVDKRVVHKDGRILHLSVCRTLVRDAASRALYCISQIQDVTERKDAIARIQRLSQLKAAISEVNRAIVRNQVPAEVFRAVCRACVDHGCFWLAWVGLADTEKQRIVPIAMSGPATSYLDDITISTQADVPEGCGPTAVAYRDQQVHICNDFAADPAIEPWRERALAHGLASSIALPLPRGGRPYGALTVYGPDKDFFDAEAVGLLEDMASNISFALDQFDREALRRQYEEELRRSEEKFRTLVENLPQHVFVMNAELTFVSCNAPYAKRLGIAAHEIAGKSDYDFYPAALAAKYERDNRRVLATGEISDVHEECIMDGETRFIQTVKAPVRNGQGEIVGVLGVFWDITAAKRAELRLEDLSHRLVAVQEDERRRLAAQLHDRLSPNLAAIKILLATLGVTLPDEARGLIAGHIEDAQALLDDTTADVRDICAELRPTLLDYAGLIPALRGYAAQFMKRTIVAVHVATPADGQRLEAETESTLFRIAQEALANCARHACAKNVFIELTVADEAVVLAIKDDGFGFDAGALGRPGETSGLGLITMKERAEFAGGRFILSAHPLEGTEIRVELGNRNRSYADMQSSSHALPQERGDQSSDGSIPQ